MLLLRPVPQARPGHWVPDADLGEADIGQAESFGELDDRRRPDGLIELLPGPGFVIEISSLFSLWSEVRDMA